MSIDFLFNHPNNTIAVAMTPYLYAIGAVIGAVATPFIFKFILKAPYTNCVDHVAEDPEATLEVSTETVSKEQAWLMPALFLIVVITSAIATHSNNHWSQIIINLCFTWVIIAEIFLQIRINIVTDWLPIIAIWLGLLHHADPNINNFSATHTIITCILGWSIAHIIINLYTKLKKINNSRAMLYPTIIAVTAVWSNNLTNTLIITAITSISFLILTIIEAILFNKIRIFAPTNKFFSQSIIKKMPTLSWILIFTWGYIFLY